MTVAFQKFLQLETSECTGTLDVKLCFQGDDKILFSLPGNRELFQSAIFDALVTKDFENQKLPKKKVGLS